MTNDRLPMTNESNPCRGLTWSLIIGHWSFAAALTLALVIARGAAGAGHHLVESFTAPAASTSAAQAEEHELFIA